MEDDVKDGAATAVIKPSKRRRKYENAGRTLPDNKIQAILTLLHNGYSKSKISRELGVTRATVNKYLKLDAKIPQARAHAALAPLATDGSDYNVQKSLGAAIGLVNITKNHCLKLALDGAFPNVLTPLMIKQLVESERMILTLPQDVNKGRRDLYDQISGRDIALDCDDAGELGKSGEMG